MEKKKRSPLVWLLGVVHIAFAFLTLLALINNNLLYSFFGSATNAVILVFPVLCVAITVVYCVLLYKKKDIFYLIFAAVSVGVLIAAFAFSSSASNAKIQGDFLKHETAFNHSAQVISETGDTEAMSEELSRIVPTKKVEVLGDVVFFYTLDSDDRVEGYAYMPSGNYPIAWDINYTEWSDALDINSKWFYICIYK